jgi:RNA polymerase sigma factor (sigma-70 family)
MADIRSRVVAEIPRLRRYARAMTRDATAADDVVQDCLTRVMSKGHLWQEGTDLRAWLFTILHNQYVNQVRRSVREGTAVAVSDTEPVLTSAPNQDKRLEVRDLERALAKLPEEQQSALLLVGMEGMRYEEAAAILGVAVGTIRSRLSRGREALRQLMGVENEPEEAALDTDAPPRRRLPDSTRAERAVSGLGLPVNVGRAL